MTLNDLEPQKVGVFSKFLAILGCDMTLKSKIVGFSEFLTISGCDAHLKCDFSLQILKIEQDNVHMKLN